MLNVPEQNLLGSALAKNASGIYPRQLFIEKTEGNLAKHLNVTFYRVINHKAVISDPVLAQFEQSLSKEIKLKKRDFKKFNKRISTLIT